jgi:xylulokinase
MKFLSILEPIKQHQHKYSMQDMEMKRSAVHGFYVLTFLLDQLSISKYFKIIDKNDRIPYKGFVSKGEGLSFQGAGISYSTSDNKVKSALIGLDLGTTVCKGILVDDQLKIIAQAERYYPLINISGEEIEQDANLWWEISLQVFKQLLAAPAAASCEVIGISVSTQGISFVPVDCSLIPLRNAFSWLDIRASSQIKTVLERIDEKELFRITGKRASSAYVLAKLLWFREREPGLFSRTHKFLMTLDFILAKLTGAVVTDHTMASGTLFYDLREQTWSRIIVQSLDLDEAKLPEIRWSGTVIGRIRKEVAAEVGLSRDVRVSIGGQDQKVAALGAGIDLHRTTVSLGTAMAITQKSAQPIIDEAMRLPCFSDLFHNRWVLEGSGTGTSGLDWIKNTLFSEKSYEELNRMAGSEEGKPLYFYPFFTGAGSPHFIKEVRGFLYGLDYAVNAGHLVRSVYEGVGYRIREITELMEEINNPIHELRLFGGGSKSSLWAQIIADITAKPVVTLFTSEAGCLGAAILAGMGSGIFTSPERAFEHLKIARVFEPQQSAVSRYDERFHQYKEIGKKVLYGESAKNKGQGGRQ